MIDTTPKTLYDIASPALYASGALDAPTLQQSIARVRHWELGQGLTAAPSADGKAVKILLDPNGVTNLVSGTFAATDAQLKAMILAATGSAASFYTKNNETAKFPNSKNIVWGTGLTDSASFANHEIVQVDYGIVESKASLATSVTTNVLSASGAFIGNDGSTNIQANIIEASLFAATTAFVSELTAPQARFTDETVTVLSASGAFIGNDGSTSIQANTIGTSLFNATIATVTELTSSSEKVGTIWVTNAITASNANIGNADNQTTIYANYVSSTSASLAHTFGTYAAIQTIQTNVLSASNAAIDNTGGQTFVNAQSLSSNNLKLSNSTFPITASTNLELYASGTLVENAITPIFVDSYGNSTVPFPFATHRNTTSVLATGTPVGIFQIPIINNTIDYVQLFIGARCTSTANPSFGYYKNNVMCMRNTASGTFQLTSDVPHLFSSDPSGSISAVSIVVSADKTAIEVLGSFTSSEGPTAVVSVVAEAHVRQMWVP